VIASRERRYVDVGEVNGEIFINNSSIGIYPFLVLERERRRRRKRLSKWTAIVLALPRASRHLPLFQLRIRIQGFVETCRSPCVLIGNNEYRLTIAAFGRRDSLDRGELCLYVAKAQRPLSLFWLACRCIFGPLDQRRDLRIFKGDTADISSHRSRLLVAFDGEVKTMLSPLHYRTRPGALRVFAPAQMNAPEQGPDEPEHGHALRRGGAQMRGRASMPRSLHPKARCVLAEARWR
jgi:diacylglycerol kinase family enzyme